MTHVLEAACKHAELLRYEHHQKTAIMSTAHVEFLLGADEAKEFEADIAKCVNDNGDLASRGDRLQAISRAMFARMNAHLEVQGGVARHLVQQLQALTADAAGNDDTICVERLSDDAKQTALVLALSVLAQYTRELDATSRNMQMYKHAVEVSQKEKTIYLEAARKLAALADSTKDSAQQLALVADSAKASLDAANEASERSASALRTAKEKIEKLVLEKQASKTSERIAQAVRDLQKSVYKKDDPDRPTWSKIQQQPLVCLERAVQALKRANEAKGADGNAAKCADCQALKTKLDSAEKMLETMQKQMLDDKKSLLEDRQRDKDDMDKLTQQMAKLRAENAAEKPKKRIK